MCNTFNLQMNQEIESSIRVIAAIITIAFAAQITIDIGPIPITGQTLAILCWAFFLSPGGAIMALLFYLILGFIGVPIFADRAHGLDKLYGGSGGYLIGFLIASGTISYLYTYSNSKSFITVISLTAVGTLIILLFGVGRLVMLYGFRNGIEYGLIPFWQGALVKIFIGSLIVWTIKRYILKSKLEP